MALDSTGLTILRLPEIIAAMQQTQQEEIDPNINTGDDSLLSQLTTIFAAQVSAVYELAQAVYDNYNIDKAEGKNLDDLATLRDVTRIAASKSVISRQQFIGEDGVVIPVGTIFSNPISGDRFTNPLQVDINTSACLSADLTVKQILNNTLYSITVESTTYNYTSSGSATANEIVTNFETLINNDTSAKWSASLNGDTLTILSDDTTPIAIVTITYISADSVTVEGVLEAEEEGDIVAPINSVTNVVSVIPGGGLTSTTNLTQGILGRLEETDEELRLRIASSSSGDCTGTIPSIESALLNNVSGIASVEITENAESTNIFDVSGVSGTFQVGDVVTGGTSGATGTITEIIDSNSFRVRVLGVNFQISEVVTGSLSGATGTLDKDFPYHSYETVVVGGTNADVAQELWRTKPTSIRLYGNTLEVILDSNGKPRDIYFTRPTVVNIAVQVSYTLYSEEMFPVSGEDLIREEVLNFINALVINEDVIPGRMFGPIYNTVSGIDELTVEIQVLANSGDPPVGGSWQTTKIVIDSDEFANTANQDIYIIDVTPP